MGFLDGIGIGDSLKELAQVLNSLMNKGDGKDNNINFKTNVCVQNMKGRIKQKYLHYCKEGKTADEALDLAWQECLELYTSENGERVNKVVEGIGKADSYFKKELWTHNQNGGGQI